MVQLFLGANEKRLEQPFLVRIYGVDEAEFDRLIDDHEKADLIDGVLIVHSPAARQHEEKFGLLFFLLAGYVSRRKLGEVLGSKMTIHLAPCRLLESDIIFVREERLSQFERTQFEGAPDLVVEILSPWTRSYDLKEKRQVYRDAGVPEIWFVDPDRPHIIVDRREGDSYKEEVLTHDTLDSSAIEGFRMPLSWLYDDPPPDPLTCLLELVGAG